MLCDDYELEIVVEIGYHPRTCPRECFLETKGLLYLAIPLQVIYARVFKGRHLKITLPLNKFPYMCINIDS